MGIDEKKLENYCADGSLVTIRRNVAHEAFPIHSHNFAELVIVLSGSAVHKTSQGSFPVDVGSVFIVTPGEAHGYDVVDNNFGMVNIIFDLDRLPLFDIKEIPEFYRLSTTATRANKAIPSKPPHLTEEDLKKVQVLIEKMEIELKNSNPGYQAMVAVYFLEILVLISRYSMKQEESLEDYAYASIHKLMSWLEKNYPQKISLEKMARITGMSKRNFQRTFRHIAILSPTEYLIRLRLDKAAEQLKTTNKQISTIAVDTGFSDSNYFSRSFRRHRGCSPSEYRMRTH